MTVLNITDQAEHHVSLRQRIKPCSHHTIRYLATELPIVITMTVLDLSMIWCAHGFHKTVLNIRLGITLACDTEQNPILTTLLSDYSIEHPMLTTIASVCVLDLSEHMHPT